MKTRQKEYKVTDLQKEAPQQYMAPRLFKQQAQRNRASTFSPNELHGQYGNALVST